MPASFRFFIYENRTDRNGETPIYLRITCNRKKKYHNTGIRISPSDWNDNYSVERQNYVRRSHSNYSRINKSLDKKFSEAKEAARLLRDENKESSDAIKERLIGASKKNFFTLGYDHVDQLKRNGQFYLRKQTKATLKKLKEFNGNENLLFTEINSRYLQKFQDWMKNTKSNKGSTIRKNMSDVRRILELAREKHLIFNDPFEDVKAPEQSEPESKTKLSFEQIQKIENLELPEDSLIEHSRNLFLLSFYLCGVRFGDMATLRWKDVSGGKMEYRMSKTGSGVQVEIPTKGKTILEKYKSTDKGKDDYVFPFLDELTEQQRKDPMAVKQKIQTELANVNHKLDEISKKAKIGEKITSHVARHSFAQHMANKGISIYELSGLLRHKSIKTTERYLERINVQLANSTLSTAFEDE